MGGWVVAGVNSLPKIAEPINDIIRRLLTSSDILLGLQ